MKKVIATTAFLVFTGLFFASTLIQAQTDTRGFNFQGYALDANGNALGSTDINVKFSVYVTGSAVEYAEVHSVKTDAYGVFSLGIGTETPLTAVKFRDLNFHVKNYWLKVEVKKVTDGSYTTISDAALMAVPYARSASNGVPVGTVISFAGPEANIPAGWMICDGRSVTQAEYPQLYAAIGNAWGGSGSNFNIPDLRGMFLRGVAGASTNDPDKASRTASATGGNIGNEVGSKQVNEIQSHLHPAELKGSTDNAGNHRHNTGIDVGAYSGTGSFSAVSSSSNNASARGTDYQGIHNHPITLNGNTFNAGGNETRPINAYVYYIIKF